MPAGQGPGESYGSEDGLTYSCPLTVSTSLHTPDGSDAAKPIGQGSPGGFQTHSPGEVWFQRFGEPCTVIAGVAKALSERVSGNTIDRMMTTLRIRVVADLMSDYAVSEGGLLAVLLARSCD